MVYDQSEQLPGCEWTKDHTAQGFARRKSTVCFGTLLESGHADVAITIGPYKPQGMYERVISVPFHCLSGKVTIEGPEEIDMDRVFNIPQGNYRLTAAQVSIGDDKEQIDLFFEQALAPLKQSVILVADELINPPRPLIETAGIAGI